MAFDVLDEHEQGELVQKWLRENVLSIAVGIGLGLLLIFGYQQWRRHQISHRMDAATQFQVFATDLDKKDITGAKAIGDKLNSDYSNTPYATLSSLRMAEYYASRDDHKNAGAALRNAYEHAAIPALKTLSGLYLAKSEIAQNKPKAALTMIDKLPLQSYSALRNEIRGDALAALGRKSEARKAYTLALTGSDPSMSASSSQKFIEMKLNNLTVAGEHKGS